MWQRSAKMVVKVGMVYLMERGEAKDAAAPFG